MLFTQGSGQIPLASGNCPLHSCCFTGKYIQNVFMNNYTLGNDMALHVWPVIVLLQWVLNGNLLINYAHFKQVSRVDNMVVICMLTKM